jgi:hypothetical protein
MHRTTVFLILALFVGIALMFARFKGHEQNFGGIGRYQNRGDNTAAWSAYADYKTPSPRDLLKYVCTGGCPDTTYIHTLLPSDNLKHILLSFRDSLVEHDGDPIQQFESVIYQEQGIQIQGRLSSRSTLADFLKIMNELLGPKMRVRAVQDSIAKAQFEIHKTLRQEQKRRDSIQDAETRQVREQRRQRWMDSLASGKKRYPDVPNGSGTTEFDGPE